MWPITNFTICFRGLLVVHKVDTVQPNFFEVGVVKDDVHFLRINTIKNGVLANTTFFDPAGVNHNNRMWSLEVTNPIAPGVSSYERPGTFNREDHPDERDYRWITELGKLFETPPNPDLEQNINPAKFLAILKVPNGIFSTRLKSEPLSMLVDGEPEFFGCTGAVVACDIPTLAGSVRLVDGEGGLLFTFDADENTIYEFANTPPDVPDLVHHGHHEGEDNTVMGENSTDPCRNEHFKRYYQVFNQQPEKSICFKKLSASPAPDPATCGVAGAGGIRNPFGGS